MRITKKFSRTRLIGKSSYKRAGEASPDEPPELLFESPPSTFFLEP